MQIIDLIALIFIIIGIFIFLLGQIKSLKNRNYVKEKDKNHHFAIIIPARDESKVIEGLLQSIKKQTLKQDMKDVYVVVEEIEDKTVDICKRYNASVIVRKHLNLKRKGYAIDEAIKEILSSKKKYDAYFIMDADNILDKDYLKNMCISYDLGYDFGIGYRNCKNGNDSVVAAASSLTFSMINTLSNNMKKKRTNTMTISGTGFYIRGYLIEKWGGYPFNSLTEDYELSLYATLNSLTTDYNTKAIFYDEQPVKYKQTINQRMRWIKGYFDARKKYIPKMKKKLKEKNNNYGSLYLEIVGVKPFIFMAIGIVVSVINKFSSLIRLVINGSKAWYYPVLSFVWLFFIIYTIMVLITSLMLNLESDKLNLNNKMKIKVALYNPIYLLSYIPCAIKAMLKKDVKWEKVEHNKTMVDKN